MPGKTLRATVRNIGGTTGPPWDRRFECKLGLDEATAELRPGMSVRLTITTQKMTNVLWLPSQALFESDGRSFVYLQSGSSFHSKDVKLVRRSESSVVVEGLTEGQLVALANPDQIRPKRGGAGKGGAMEAIQR
jgi:hypothetical protein